MANGTMLKYYPMSWGAIGVVVYMPFNGSPSWSIWMIPGGEEGL